MSPEEAVEALQPKENNLWEYLFGKPAVANAPPSQSLPASPLRTDYPNSEDVAISNKYDLGYGDPVAPYLKSGNTKVDHTSIEGAIAGYDGRLAGGTPKYLSDQYADQIHKAWLAARRSPTAALGFQPQNTVVTDQPGRAFGYGSRGEVAGYYDPSTNKTWFNFSHPNSQVHESMHRGINTLRKAGQLPFQIRSATEGSSEEEHMVRALMMRHLGDIEAGPASARKDSEPYRLIERAKEAFTPKQIDDLENAAAMFAAKRRPGGPR